MSNKSLILICILSLFIIVKNNEIVGILPNVLKKSFEDNKIFLLELYAPGCGSCSDFEPHFKAFADKLNNKDIMVAKMNGTTKEGWAACQTWEVDSFPAVVMYVEGKEFSVFYATDKKEHHLTQWYQKHIAKTDL